jgi:hypothetical protein
VRNLIREPVDGRSQQAGREQALDSMCNKSANRTASGHRYGRPQAAPAADRAQQVLRAHEDWAARQEREPTVVSLVYVDRELHWAAAQRTTYARP